MLRPPWSSRDLFPLCIYTAPKLALITRPQRFLQGRKALSTGALCWGCVLWSQQTLLPQHRGAEGHLAQFLHAVATSPPLPGSGTRLVLLSGGHGVLGASLTQMRLCAPSCACLSPEHPLAASHQLRAAWPCCHAWPCLRMPHCSMGGGMDLPWERKNTHSGSV